MNVTVYLVNAFTAAGKNGNPAGVVFDADNLTDAQMLDIAAKVGVSETAFISESDVATYKVRFFTPVSEVSLCGHATIATWSLLRSCGDVTAGQYTQETLAGTLRVRVSDDGLIFMEQTKPGFFDVISADELAPLLGISTDVFHATLKPQIVSTGLKDVMVPLADKIVLSELRPDFAAIAAFTTARNITGLHVFSLLNASNESLAAARNFDPVDGIPEECATGTSNGALLCYLKHYKKLPTTKEYRIEQGEAMGKLSYIYGTFIEDAVWMGGYAKQHEMLQIRQGDR